MRWKALIVGRLKALQVSVIRGSDQIGGSIIEVSTDGTRIILDVGAELDGRPSKAPMIEGLFQGAPTYDAVLISHYHADHLGLLDDVLKGIPVYMGEKALAVFAAELAYK